MIRVLQIAVLILLFGLALFSFLTKNSDKAEMQNIGFVSSFAVDMVDTNFRVTLEVINPIRLKANTTSQQPATLTYSAIGRTLGDAANQLFLKIPLTIKLNTLQMILIQEEVVKQNSVIQIADYFVRNHDVSQSPPIVIVKDSQAADLLGVFLPFNDITAMSIFFNIDKIRSKISDFQYYADDILYLNHLPGKDILLPVVKLVGNQKMGENPQNISILKPPVDVQTDGLAIFRKGKLVDYMSEAERELFAYFYEINSFTSLTVPNDMEPAKDAKVFSIKISENDSKMYVAQWKSLDRPSIQVEIEMSGFIDSYHGVDNLEQLNQQDLEKLVEASVRNNLLNLYEKEKRLNAYFLGLGATLYRLSPEKYEQFVRKFSEPMEQIDFDVMVKMEIHFTGDLKGMKQVGVTNDR